MAFILIGSKSELLMDMKKKAAQVLEETEEMLIHGKSLKDNTFPRFFIDREAGLTVLPS